MDLLSDVSDASPTIQKKPIKKEAKFYIKTAEMVKRLLNLTSGTNRAGLGPVAFRMAVSMSKVVKPASG